MHGYDKLFRELLPSMVKEFDSDRFYVHSSPYLANWGRPESWGIGDSHNWGVWYGKKPFESLDTDLPRFMSEFGFQSFPEMKTIAAFAAPEDYHSRKFRGFCVCRISLARTGDAAWTGSSQTQSSLLYGDIVLAVERQLAGGILVKY